MGLGINNGYYDVQNHLQFVSNKIQKGIMTLLVAFNIITWIAVIATVILNYRTRKIANQSRELWESAWKRGGPYTTNEPPNITTVRLAARLQFNRKIAEKTLAPLHAFAEGASWWNHKMFELAAYKGITLMRDSLSKLEEETYRDVVEELCLMKETEKHNDR